jgi:hypothetical protein
VKPLDAADMTRRTAKRINKKMKELGVKVKPYNQTQSTEEVKQAVTIALATLSTPNVLARLNRVDPAKLLANNQTCLGLFPNLKSNACNVCPDNEECLDRYLENLKAGMPLADAILKADARLIEVDSAHKSVRQLNLESIKKIMAAKIGKTKVKTLKLEWQPELPIYIVSKSTMGSDDPDVKKFEKELKKEIPETLLELYTISNKYFDLEDHALFISDLFVQLRSLGLVKIDADLTDAEREILNG